MYQLELLELFKDKNNTKCEKECLEDELKKLNNDHIRNENLYKSYLRDNKHQKRENKLLLKHDLTVHEKKKFFTRDKKLKAAINLYYFECNQIKHDYGIIKKELHRVDHEIMDIDHFIKYIMDKCIDKYID